MTEPARMWDTHAETFDDAADHGLRDPAVRAAWARLLLPLLPASATVADLGCGTGSLSVLIAGAGHRVLGLDFSRRMLAVAVTKAAGLPVSFQRGDAARPPYVAASCDVVLARHVLWALPEPAAALDRWTSLLRPGGRIVLVEGRWSTGAGLTAAECLALLAGAGLAATLRHLDDPTIWGGPIDDERYLVVAGRMP